MEIDDHPQNLMDYHLHTAVTVDGRMGENDACSRCTALGIREIAFTNHIMLTQPDYTISPRSFVDHWMAIQDCRERYPQLNIRLGIEMDYYLECEDEIAGQLKYYENLIGRPFDLVLGSVHEVNGSFFSNKHLAPSFFKDRDLVTLYREYFHVATRAAQCGIFDVMAHPDLIKKYTHDLTPPVAFESYRESIDPFIDALVSSGVGIEVNTKGLKLSVNEIYPSDDFLRLYLDHARIRGVAPVITLGSDAHKVEDVGLYITETISSLRQLGIDHLTCFDQRQKSAFII